MAKVKKMAMGGMGNMRDTGGMRGRFGKGNDRGADGGQGMGGMKRPLPVPPQRPGMPLAPGKGGTGQPYMDDTGRNPPPGMSQAEKMQDYKRFVQNQQMNGAPVLPMAQWDKMRAPMGQPENVPPPGMGARDPRDFGPGNIPRPPGMDGMLQRAGSGGFSDNFGMPPRMGNPDNAPPPGMGGRLGMPPPGYEKGMGGRLGMPPGMGGGMSPPSQSQMQGIAGAMGGMGGKMMKKGGAVKAKAPVKKMAKGGMTSSASKRGDGIAQKGKTRGKMC